MKNVVLIDAPTLTPRAFGRLRQHLEALSRSADARPSIGLFAPSIAQTANELDAWFRNERQIFETRLHYPVDVRLCRSWHTWKMMLGHDVPKTDEAVHLGVRLAQHNAFESTNILIACGKQGLTVRDEKNICQVDFVDFN